MRMTPLRRDLDVSAGNRDLCLFNIHKIRCLFLSVPSGLSSLMINFHRLLQASPGQDLLRRRESHSTKNFAG